MDVQLRKVMAGQSGGGDGSSDGIESSGSKFTQGGGYGVKDSWSHYHGR